MVSIFEDKAKAIYERRLKEIDDFSTTKSNKQDIRQFLDLLKISYTRKLKYLCILKNIARWTDFNFKDATREDISKLVDKIEAHGYKQQSEKDVKVTLKYLFKVIYGDMEEYPRVVRWVKTGLAKHKQEKKGEIVTLEDVKRILHYLDYLRDKALISLAFDSGARPSEYLTLKLKDVNDFKEKAGVLTCKVKVAGKTGVRSIYLTDIAPTYLYEWKNKHPDKDNPNAYFFPPHSTSYSKTPHIGIASVRKILKQTFADLKIDKPANPYWLRHSGITNHHKDGILPRVAEQQFGWSTGSKQPATYVHLSGRDVEDMIDKQKGITPSDKEEVEQQKKCNYCGHLNGLGEVICQDCNKPLDLKNEYQELQKNFAKAMTDPNFMKMVIQASQEYSKEEMNKEVKKRIR